MDYWVARAEGEPAIFESGACKYHYDDRDGTWDQNWHPSTDWSQGGPIIEKEGIHLCWEAYGGNHEWYAEHEKVNDAQPKWRAVTFYAATPLMAAMRAYVASKFGEEVG